MIMETSVYFCIIHDEIVYDELSRFVNLEKSKKFVDEIASGKRTKFSIFFGKGTFAGLGSHENEYIIMLEEILYSSEERHITYNIGTPLHLHSRWIELGTYAREKFLMNPSRRKEIYKDAKMSFL